eukprot:jgi/Mesvir1/5601/Mv15619-RA.1
MQNLHCIGSYDSTTFAKTKARELAMEFDQMANGGRSHKSCELVMGRALWRFLRGNRRHVTRRFFRLLRDSMSKFSLEMHLLSMVSSPQTLVDILALRCLSRSIARCLAVADLEFWIEVDEEKHTLCSVGKDEAAECLENLERLLDEFSPVDLDLLERSKAIECLPPLVAWHKVDAAQILPTMICEKLLVD